MTKPVSGVELQLRAAIDAAPSGILMTDARGFIVLANRQIESMFGYSREELLGRSVELLLPEELRERHLQDRAAFVSDPSVRVMGAGRELYGLRKDGTQIPLEIGLTPVVTSEGMFVVSAIVDISARKRAEARFRTAVESSPSGMLMIDREGHIVLVNKEIERMFGYPRSELLNQPVEILVPSRFRDAHPLNRSKFFASPKTRAMGIGRDLFGVRKDGTEIPVEIGLNPIVTEEGLFVLGTVLDIAARKLAEQEHRRLEGQLHHAQKMEAVGRLASGIAHDFNNVLMGIISCGGLLKRSLPSDHPGHSLVDDMCNAAQRGATLSRDLLNFSRRKPADAVPSELNAVVLVAQRMLRQMIGEDIELEVDLCPSGGPILGNPTHLEHILLNLSVNARDAMPNGGTLRISTRELESRDGLTTRGRALPPGSYVALDIEDSGTGMDAVTRERLFEPFFTTKELGSGTGLGLFTVYSIVDQLGGGIDVVSQPGRGTRFTIYFPRLNDPVAKATDTIAPVPDQAGEEAARILVVEDERLIRTTIHQMLTRLGYDVLVAESAGRALAVAESCPGNLDLLLSDMVLPDASGAELARTLAKLRPTMKVLFMSAYPTELLVAQGRIKAGTRSLEKPFDETMLVAAVREMLSSSATKRVTSLGT
jgi:PAS domain S-box-containing protein